MKSIDRYKNQHKIILSLCTALEDAAVLTVLEKKFSYYQSVLKTLDNILAVHLESEDNFLYPDFAQDNSKKVRETAQRLQEEMAPVTAVYVAYKKRYLLKENVFSDTDTFLQETKVFVLTLQNRINKEEKELYPLI